MSAKKYDMTGYLKKIDEVIERGPFSADWDSLVKYEVPEWYKDAKFGIFIHWGIYSVPAFGSEWYSRNMYIQGDPCYEHHRKTYGPQEQFGYKDFIPMFKAEKFDADAWTELFTKAGAKYVVPVAEHHDGFQMYQSEISHWNAAEMGPKRDILGELGESCKKKELRLCASSHRIEHWFFMGHGKEFASDVKEPMERGDFYWPAMSEPKDHFNSRAEVPPTKEFLDDWLVRTCELIDKYRPSTLYFDWWIIQEAAKEHLKKLTAYYYNRAAEWNMGVVINYKHDAYAFGSAVPDVERGVFADVKPYYWQTDTSVARNSWGYTKGNDYKSSKELVQYLADVVSKNGNLLLNIGPKADGTIPEEDEKLLLEIGEWLSVNGEAIYGTHPWKTYGDGPTRAVEGQYTDGKAVEYTNEDFRYTAKGTNIYIIAMEPADNGSYCIKDFARFTQNHHPVFQGIIDGIDVLGGPQNIPFEQKEDGMYIQYEKKDVDMPVVFKVRTI